MAGTLTYNFDPGQTVFVIIDCDAESKTVQRFPATGNLSVREGIVRELSAGIFANRQNANSKFSVKVLGGVVTTTGLPAQMTVDVVAGVVTAVALVNDGSAYLDGTGFTFLLATTAGGGDGAAEITYDVVDGEATNVSVSVGGTTYTDGLLQVVTDVTQPTGIRTSFRGRGYFPDTAQATFTIDVVAGVVEDVVVTDGGAQYTNGTGFSFLLASDGDGAASISYDVVDNEITNVGVAAGGTGYTNGFGQAVAAADVPVSQNSFFLTNTAGGGDGAASIGYNVIGGEIVNAEVLTGGTTYTDRSSASVSNLDSPPANEVDHELIYNVRLDQSGLQRFDIEVPVGADGVELQGDIFDNVTDAVDEYETRI